MTTATKRYALEMLFGPGRPEMVGHVPHARVLGIRALETGSGLAVACALEELISIATIDLRVDYLRAASPGLDLHARSECYRVTRNVAFVRAVAYEHTADDPFAACLGTFILGANRSDSPFERMLPG